MVPEAGLEPARYFYRGILSPLCLPIPPLGLFYKTPSFSLDNFKVLYITSIKLVVNFKTTSSINIACIQSNYHSHYK